MERRDNTFGKRQRRAQPDTEGPPRQDEASLSPMKSVYNESGFWRERLYALTGAYADAWLASYAAGEPVERAVLLARWSASYGLDALQMREVEPDFHLPGRGLEFGRQEENNRGKSG